MTPVFAIHPYKLQGVWVFDDAEMGLAQEPFVAGADIMIDRMVQDIANADDGFTLFFSAKPFPGFQVVLERRRIESGGSWYYCPAFKMEGWLCPALLKYFDPPPRLIYAQFRTA